MKTYVCHKRVQAFKITRIDAWPDGSALISGSGAAENVSAAVGFVDKHSPQVGGYFVRYADGYESYSPAAAFESGYTAVEPEANGPCEQAS